VETHPEDADLADALIAGEAWAATATYQKHAAMVYRFLHRALGTGGEAEDLTQEVFLQVFSKVRGLRNRDALKSFVFSVAIRTLKWELRRRRVRRLLQVSRFDELPEPVAPTLDPASRQMVRQLYAVLDRLSVQERAAFILRHVEQMRLEEIGEMLGVSLATVKRRLERATRAVSQEMDDGRAAQPVATGAGPVDETNHDRPSGWRVP
jgi:RNA polymerase sigma-70 factor (ECF subfamily)